MQERSEKMKVRHVDRFRWRGWWRPWLSPLRLRWPRRAPKRRLRSGAGSYSAAQSKRGEELYSGACAQCHGLRLNGAAQPDQPPSPAIARATFLRKWEGKPVAALFDYVHEDAARQSRLAHRPAIHRRHRAHVRRQQHTSRRQRAAARSEGLEGIVIEDSPKIGQSPTGSCGAPAEAKRPASFARHGDVLDEIETVAIREIAGDSQAADPVGRRHFISPPPRHEVPPAPSYRPPASALRR